MAKLSTFKGFGATSSSGSSGSSSSTFEIYDDKMKQNDTNWSSSSTYSCCMRTAGGKKGNSFFFARLEYNGIINYTRLRIYPFTVNGSTGAITWGSESNVWQNTNASATSTTYWTGPDGTGAVFSGGHNAYPGQNSHYFGYSKFIVNANGSITDGGYSSTNADHGYNGMFYTLPTSVNSGYMISGGYSGSDSLARRRVNSTDGSTVTVGSLTNLSSNTSTTYSVNMIAQPGVYQSSNQVVSLLYWQDGSGNKKVTAVSANGSTSNHSVDSMDSNAFAFQMTNGDVILYSDAHTPMKFTAYNSATTMTSASPFPAGSMYYGFAHFGLGNNEFVLGLHNSSVINFGYPLIKATLDGTTGFTITGAGNNSVLASIGMESSFTGMYPIYANASDTTPSKMVFARHQSNYIRVKVTDFPTFS